MRWDYLKLRGIGPFRDEVELDLTKLGDARLVAVVGPNGAGKSTLLEVGLPGAMDRSTPTRGSLLDLATRRDSLVETRLVNGSNWTLRHMLDAVSGKSEALVLCDGEPVLPDTKVRSFDKWRGEHLPSSEVLFASTFSAQDSKGFLEAGRTERVAVILRLVRAEHLEGLAEQARKLATKARSEFDVLAARVADERERVGDDLVLEAELGDARVTLADAGARYVALNEDRDAAERERRRIELLEQQVRVATERRTELYVAMSTAQGRLAELERRVAPHRELAARADEIRAALVRVTELRIAALEAKRQAEAERLEAERVRARRAELDQAAERASERVCDLAARVANNRAVLEQTDEIRAAASKLDAFRKRIANIDAELLELERTADQHLIAADSARKAQQAAVARAAAANQRLAGSAGLQVLAEGLDDARAQQAEALAALAAREAEVVALRGKRVAGVEERVVALRTGLSDIICLVSEHADAPVAPRLEEIGEVSVSAIETDDRVLLEASTLPSELLAAEGRFDSAREIAQSAARCVSNAQNAAARLPEIELARAELAAAEAEIRESTDRAVEQDRLAGEANLAAQGPLATERKQLAAELPKLEPLAAKLEPLTKAEARLGELEPELARATAVHEAAEAALVAAPAVVEAKPYRVDEQHLEELTRLAPIAAQSSALDAATGALAVLEPELALADGQLAKARAALEAAPPVPNLEMWLGMPDLAPAQAELQRARASVTQLTLRLEQAQAGAARVAEFEAQRALVELDLSDWNQLAADLGKDGIQAMEVDAAGPELTYLTNDLLERCHGPRFRVRIDTQRASSDGKRMLEGCDVNVLDTKEGRDAEGSTFSGGERVILGEAISLALAMYGCQRSGDTEPTLVRDESGAALDPEAVPVYVAMLRRAADVVHASRVLVVSHTPAVWDLCDARITVRERGIEIGGAG